MNKNDLLYTAIRDYFAIQSMNSFCAEAILGSNMQNTHKDLFDIYGKLLPSFEYEASRIEDACENIKILTRLNIDTLIEFCSERLDKEQKTLFVEQTEQLIEKNYCDSRGNFKFTVDAFLDIMKIYWQFERVCIARRFDDEH